MIDAEIIVHQVQVSGQHHGSLILINSAQILIKRGNPLVSGLQNVNLGLTNTSNRRIYTDTPHWAVPLACSIHNWN